MRVEDYEFGRFLVESEKTPGEFYLVDLLERGRRGICSCKDFEIRVQAALDRGDVPERDACKHIEKVRSMIPEVDTVLFRLAAFEAKCERKPMKIGGRHG